MVMFISVIEFNAMLPDNCTCYLFMHSKFDEMHHPEAQLLFMLLGNLKYLFWDR